MIAVIAVWGTIGYQIYSNMNPSTPEKQTIGVTEFNKIQTKQVRKIEISPDYRDPFLGKLYRKKKKTQPVQKQSKKVPVIFPQIDFIGLIEGSTKSYIIQINRRQEIFKVGQTFQGVTLKKAKNKSIIITYKKASKEILLKE
jgi:hypothetical protein